MADASQFVRALKSPSDPPEENGVLKIEIARQAWKNASFYVPRKGQVIVDWLLTKLQKDTKSLSIHNSAALDPLYWSLLVDILQSEHATVIKQWLFPLLNRTSIAPIILFLLNHSSEADADVLAYANKCLTVIWPLAVQRFSTETLLELFSSVVAQSQRSDPENLSLMCIRMVHSFRSSLETSSNKKKGGISDLFIRNVLKTWVSSVQLTFTELDRITYLAGTEVLFNLETLRGVESFGSQHIVDSLREIDTRHSILILGRLFSSYVDSIKKYRGALFPAPSQAPQASWSMLRQSILRFFTTCLHMLGSSIFQLEAWTCTVGLLDILSKEQISPANDATTTFHKIIRAALEVMKKDDIALVQPALQCLCVITCIDYALLSPSLPSLLNCLLIQVSCHETALILLDAILEFHVKTRTIPDYLETLLKSLSSMDSVTEPRIVYQMASSSAFFQPQHLEHLSRSIAFFLPESLVAPTFVMLTRTLGSLWERSNHRAAGKVPRPVGQELSVVVFSISVRLALVIMAALPDSSQAATLSETASNFRATILEDAVSSSLDAIIESQADWTTQVVSTAVLRLDSELSSNRNGLLPPPIHQECCERLIQLASSNLLPELTIEMFRVLLQRSTFGDAHFQVLFDKILKYANAAVEEYRLFMLSWLSDHWMAVLDARCSKSQLEEFIKLFVFRGSSGLVAGNATFWDLPNIRAAFLAVIEEETHILDGQPELELQTLNSADFERLTFVLKFLLLVPSDYLPRSVRSTLMIRASSLDIFLQTGTISESRSPESIIVSRAFVLRSLSVSTMPMASLSTYALHLIKAGIPSDQALKTLTLDLYDACILRLLSSVADSGTTNPVLDTLFSKFESSSFSGQDGLEQLFFSFVQILCGMKLSLASFPVDLQTRLRQMLKVLSKRLHSSSHPEGVKTWRHVLILARWLTVTDIAVPTVTPTLLSTVLKDGRGMSLAVEIFALLTEELHCYPADERLEVLDMIVLAYVQICDTFNFNVSPLLDPYVCQICSDLSAPHFDRIAQVIFQLWPDFEDVRVALAHLLILLLQNPPKSTDSFRMGQALGTRCLTLFWSYASDIVESPGLRREILMFMLCRCKEKPASLRLQDLDNIWAFMAKLLANSSQQADEADTTIFLDIIAIVSVLIRLRRDLVLQTLPQLGLALRRLVSLLRAPRVHLGRKQSSLLDDTFPSWMDIRQPLTAAHAKALSRLLQAIAVKTIPKIQSSAVKLQQAESLAKPFSKHAAYVLQAYIEAVNDPLCTLEADIRLELEPGLFALCDMLNKQNRDWFMTAGLSSSGKATLKLLWREYDKQHYVGAG